MQVQWLVGVDAHQTKDGALHRLLEEQGTALEAVPEQIVEQLTHHGTLAHARAACDGDQFSLAQTMGHLVEPFPWVRVLVVDLDLGHLVPQGRRIDDAVWAVLRGVPHSLH